MFNLFGKNTHIDEEFFDWSVALSRWIIANFDGLEQLRKTSLVTPGKSFFPASELTGHARAAELFEQIKMHVDMADWRCELQAQSERPPHMLGDSLQKFETSPPIGTYSERRDGDEIKSIITYDPAQLKTPENLVATLSHELAHLLMTSAKTEFPFDPELKEPATDGLAIMMGFGVFIANGSSGFHRDDQSWGYHRSGYLCEGEILHMLSAFMHLSRNNPGEAKRWLKPHLYKRLTGIHEEMAARAEITGLAS